jgi:hypothetical protein
LDDLNVGWLGVFIAPTTKLAVWWRLLSHGAPDSPVRQPRHQAVALPCRLPLPCAPILIQLLPGVLQENPAAAVEDFSTRARSYPQSPLKPPPWIPTNSVGVPLGVPLPGRELARFPSVQASSPPRSSAACSPLCSPAGSPASVTLLAQRPRSSPSHSPGFKLPARTLCSTALSPCSSYF